MVLAAKLLETLIQLELTLTKPEVRASRKALDKLLGDDFFEIPAHGEPFGKEAVLVRLPREKNTDFRLYDFQLRELAPGLVQLVYEASMTRDGRTTRSWRTSIWKETDGNWQMLYHQGTPAGEDSE